MNGVRWVDTKTLIEDFGFGRAIAAISEASNLVTTPKQTIHEA
jgi:hypothetical protein